MRVGGVKDACHCWSNLCFPYCSLYLKQLREAESANVKLGGGIALFQALSNLAINGQFL